VQNLDETIKLQEKRINMLNKSIERDEDDDLERDPYVNVQIKRERMPYHKTNVYRPLNHYNHQDMVILLI
jgi:hypothetical protein